MSELVTARIVIYAKDVSILTGLSLRTSWNLLARIKKHYNKEKTQFVTIREFSDFTGISVIDIATYMKNH